MWWKVSIAKEKEGGMATELGRSIEAGSCLGGLSINSPRTANESLQSSTTCVRPQPKAARSGELGPGQLALSCCHEHAKVFAVTPRNLFATDALRAYSLYFIYNITFIIKF